MESRPDRRFTSRMLVSKRTSILLVAKLAAQTNELRDAVRRTAAILMLGRGGFDEIIVSTLPPQAA